MPTTPIHLDTLIFGGGVAGLWLLDDLRRAGHRVMLIEAYALGSGQTVGSQGIVHGGMKYSLKGMVNASARAIAEMPIVWREALAGQREPDLSRTSVRSDHCHLWVSPGQRGRATMAATKLVLRVTPQTIPVDDWPTALRGSSAVYRMDEQVIDTVAMTETFAQRNHDHLLRIDLDHADALSFETSDSGDVTAVYLRDPSGESLTLHPRHVVLTAGRGNADLRERLGLSTSVMQRRPLHMVMARGPLPPLHAHCIDRFKTRMTVTSATSPTDTIWQIGGQLAEDGVDLSPDELIRHAAAEVAQTLPAVDFSSTRWATYRIDRAESANDGKRPETVSLLRDGNLLTAWPTKLALAPQLARMIHQQLSSPAVDEAIDLAAATRDWPRPTVALPPWEQADVTWTDYPEVSPR